MFCCPMQLLTEKTICMFTHGDFSVTIKDV